MFVQRINNITGEREWTVKDEHYDMAQEIARSRFSDMILDYNRNQMFLAGLKTVITELKNKGQSVGVLDIGTGTGLLSLMAAREGADQVTAVEVFSPMVDCAKKIVLNSGWNNKITVLPSRSTDLVSLTNKPNVIVAEVFDTELIGEGALRTFKEALMNLAKPGCRVVPSLGRVWVMLVQSKFLASFNQVPRLTDKGFEEELGPLGCCPGTSAVFDLQLSQVRQEQFTPLSKPTLAFSFDFESADSIIYNESFDREVECIESGSVDAIMMWWDLDMDRTGSNWIDMAPSWANKHFKWRDHWMQAVYYLPNKVVLQKGKKFILKCNHDEFSMWFSVGLEPITRPYCNCGLHTLLTRQSIFRLNNLMNDRRLAIEVKKICLNKNVVVVGEGSLLGLLTANYASSVIIVESNNHFRSILERYIMYYGLNNVSIIVDVNAVKEKPDVVLSEPFYLSAMNSWENLRFWYDASALVKKFSGNIEIWPKEGILYGISEQFTDLHKIASPVGTVSGFDLSYFDELSQKARQATDALVDEQPLWEYEGILTGKKFEVMRFNIEKEPGDMMNRVMIPLKNYTNGISLWMEWQIGDYVITTGLIESHILEQPNLESTPKWTEGMKQGVYLIPPKLLQKDHLILDVRFISKHGDVVFQFY